jgi:hypothetical protein
MAKKIVAFEKYRQPDLIEDDGDKLIWLDKKGRIHNGLYRPAVIYKDYRRAEFWVNGEEIRAENILNIKEQIQEIINEFDFEKVNKTMIALDWIWAGSKTHNSIPSIYELKQEAKRLLKDAAEGMLKHDTDYYFVSTGGFCATSSELGLKLEFIVSEWDSRCFL